VSAIQTKFPAPLKSTALSATPGIRLLFIACQQMEIGTKPIPISVLTAVINSALNAASVFPSRRIEIGDSHTDLNRSADFSIFRLWTRLRKIFKSRQNSTSISERAIIEWQIESVLLSRAAKIVCNTFGPKAVMSRPGSGRRHRQRAQLAGLDVRYGWLQVVEGDLDLAGEEIGEHGCRAAIRNVLHVDSGHLRRKG
jgi:hypothetical protein